MYIPGKLLVNFNGTGEDVDQFIKAHNLTMVSYIHMLNLGTIQVAEGMEEDTIQKLSAYEIVGNIERKPID